MLVRYLPLGDAHAPSHPTCLQADWPALYAGSALASANCAKGNALAVSLAATTPPLIVSGGRFARWADCASQMCFRGAEAAVLELRIWVQAGKVSANA